MEENHKGNAKTLAFRQARTAWANGSISFAHAESIPYDWQSTRLAGITSPLGDVIPGKSG